MKNLPQPYQSCSRRASGSSGQPGKWSFYPLRLLYLKEETAAGLHCQRQTRRPVSIPAAFPNSYEKKACPQPQAPASFPFASPFLGTRSIQPFIPPKTEKSCTGYAFSQVFLRADMLPYHLMFIILCNWTENMQIVLLANAKYGTTKSSTNNSSAPGHRFGKTVNYYTLELYRHKEEYCSEVWVILQHREMNVHLLWENTDDWQ